MTPNADSGSVIEGVEIALRALLDHDEAADLAGMLAEDAERVMFTLYEAWASPNSSGTAR